MQIGIFNKKPVHLNNIQRVNRFFIFRLSGSASRALSGAILRARGFVALSVRLAQIRQVRRVLDGIAPLLLWHCIHLGSRVCRKGGDYEGGGVPRLPREPKNSGRIKWCVKSL